MLLNITDKCRMNCIHCMDDCKETNNNEMAFDILKKVCKIIGNVNSTDKEIINNILLEECNTCKYLNDKVDNFYKEIIKLGQQKLRED